MKRRNIFFSVIIVLTMILGMYPQNAFATEIQENIQNENQEESSNNKQEMQVSNQEDQVAESSTQTVHQTKKDEAVTLSNDSYTVSTDEELKNALEQIKTSSSNEASIILNADVGAPTENYIASFGVEGKHIIVSSTEGNMYSLSLSNLGILNGSCTFENVDVRGSKLYCTGYKTIFTNQGEIHLTGTLYGGGYKTTVASTYVVIDANGYINPSSSSGLHDVIGGSYQGSVEGNTYLEITGNIQMQGGNHLNPGCVMGDGSSNDGAKSPDVYVGGNAILIYDNQNGKSSPAIEGTYGCEMKGNVTLDIRSGRANEICGTQEYSTKSIIRGDLHIIAGAKKYENTDRTLRLNGNWPIVGAGNSFAESPSEEGTYEVGGNITIDTFENVWGWDKGTEPPFDDIPEIYGAIDSNVGGNITLNINGSHMENITGAWDSNVKGDVTVNAINVDLRNSYYETEYDEGDILVGYYAIIEGKSIINVDGGDINIVRLTNKKQVNEGSSITIKGSPKIRTGVLSTINYESSPENTPIVALDACQATIPFIQSASKVHVKNNSNVLVNGLWLVRDLTVDQGSVLKTNDEDPMKIDGDVIVNGTWEQLYAQAKDDYACTIAKTMTIGNQGQYISHGTVDIKEKVNSSGMMVLMKHSLFELNYTGDDAEIRLPAVSKNYDGSDDGGVIPLQIKGQSTGSTKVYTVNKDDWQSLQTPILGDNYILSKKDEDKPQQNVFVLENEDAINQDLYLKRMKDANGKDDYYMWQVTTGIRVTFDKNGGETEASPKTSLQDYVAGKTNYHFDLPTKNPTRKGYTFKGWNTKADGTGETFDEKTNVTKSMTVYAMWQEDVMDQPITITPMDLTIYTGGNGYTGVIGPDGTFSKNDLPEIGFYVTLPDEVNKLIGNTNDHPIDLSDKIALTYNDNNGVTRSWKLELYGDKDHSQTVVNGKYVYIYKVCESQVDGTETMIPARIQFTSDDGTVMIDSKFPVSETDQYRDYKINFYTGKFNEELYQIKIKLDDQTIICSAKLGTGTLKVRGNVNQYYSDISDTLPKLDSTNKNKIYIQTAQKNTTYFINNSNVKVTDSTGVKLLVDKTLDDPLLVKYLDQNKNAKGKYSYEFNYLDLVDTHNGNDYIALKDGQKMNIYWPVPSEAKENSHFHIVHFKGLSRDSDYDINDLLTTNIPEEISCEVVTIENQKFVKFSVDSFSPFALLYEKENGVHTNDPNEEINQKDNQDTNKQTNKKISNETITSTKTKDNKESIVKNKQTRLNKKIKTGDFSRSDLWISLMILSLILFYGIKKIKQKV